MLRDQVTVPLRELTRRSSGRGFDDFLGRSLAETANCKIKCECASGLGLTAADDSPRPHSSPVRWGKIGRGEIKPIADRCCKREEKSTERGHSRKRKIRRIGSPSNSPVLTLDRERRTRVTSDAIRFVRNRTKYTLISNTFC